CSQQKRSAGYFSLAIYGWKFIPWDLFWFCRIYFYCRALESFKENDHSFYPVIVCIFYRCIFNRLGANDVESNYNVNWDLHYCLPIILGWVQLVLPKYDRHFK